VRAGFAARVRVLIEMTMANRVNERIGDTKSVAEAFVILNAATFVASRKKLTLGSIALTTEITGVVVMLGVLRLHFPFTSEWKSSAQDDRVWRC